MYKAFKRIFDVISSFLLLLAISPVFITLCILVGWKIGTPIFFKQKRVGKNGKEFHLYKFRTMTNETDEEGNLLPDNLRLVAFGRWLRSTSMDELPELLNIIKGDMAVIGPRPLFPEYNKYYTEYESHRFKVRGGLIPPEAMYCDNYLTWDKQLEYEADYATNVSFGLDMKILLSVFKTLFLRSKTDYGNYTRLPLTEERKIDYEKNIGNCSASGR